MQPTTTLPGYRTEHLLQESARSALFHAVRLSDNARVIIKFPKASRPSAMELAGLQNEYTVLTSHHIKGVIKPLEFAYLGATAALVREDVGAVSLKKFADGKALELALFLDIAYQAASALDSLHQQTIIHKDIKSANILIHPETHDVYLTDFSSASRLPSENQTPLPPSLLQGTFAYMSPEQTGRMNILLDQRTDLYSLGVTLYELLTGVLPFDMNDALELLYAHIAQQPRHPSEFRPDIPPIVSAIVMKLLAKSPNDRYQTASGLAADIDICRTELRAKKTIADFALAKHDTWTRIQAPHTIYGREAETAVLQDIFETVCAGNVRILLVGGYSGVGKTRLVGEVFRPLTRARGNYAVGKFDQLRSNTPYSAVVQAFRSYLRQLLADSDENVNSFRERLKSVLGVNVAVVAGILPELEIIFGKLPPAPELPSAEQQNRFNLTIRQFVEVLGRKEHPLVLFLDDMQWADTASLRLIEVLTDGPLQQNPEVAVLFVLAYRSNEVQTAHPFSMTVQRAEQIDSALVGRIELLPLAERDSAIMIQDMLGIHNAEQESALPTFLGLVYGKTGGNPFFMQELLALLTSRNLLRFDTTQQRWQWDIPRIQALNVTDNIADLVAERLQKLPDSTRTVLGMAAALGSTFDIQSLLCVAPGTPSETLQEIQSMMRENLVVVRDGHVSSMMYVRDDIDILTLHNTDYNTRFAFVHDRVQQAAYSLVIDTNKPSLHQEIGQALTQLLENNEDRLFDIIRHLNIGHNTSSEHDKDNPNEFHNTEQRDRIMRLNARAAARAREANAYQQGLEYAEVAWRLLPNEAWRQDYTFTLELSIEYARCLYLSGSLDAALHIFTQAKAQVRDVLDEARIFKLEIIVKVNLNQTDEILAGVVLILKKLGVTYTDAPSRGDVFRELIRAEHLLWRKTPEYFLAMPEMTDPYKHLAQEIFQECVALAYNHSQELSGLTFMKMLTIGMEYGASSTTGYAMAVFGALEGTLFGRYKRGLELGRAGLTMVERFGDQLFVGRSRFNTYCLLTHWLEPARNGLSELRSAYSDCIQTGDIAFSVYIVCTISDYNFFLGRPFSELTPETRGYITFLKRTKNSGYMPYHIGAEQMMLALQGTTHSLDSFSDDSFNEVEYEQFLEQNKDAAVANLAYYLRRLQALYLCGFYDKAEPYAEKIQAQFFAIQATLNGPEYLFYRGMLSAVQLPHASSEKQSQHRKYLAASLKAFKKYAQNCAVNHRHKYLLLQAEDARLRGKNQQARALYAEAVVETRKNGFLQHEAIASERAARFADAHNDRKEAEKYFWQSHQTYLRWGASAKAEQLAREFAGYFTANSPSDKGYLRELGMLSDTSSLSPSSSASSSSQSTSTLLDVMSVVRASQAISEEIVLSSLMQRMMRVVMANAGAQTAQLLVPSREEEHRQDPQFTLKASANALSDAVTLTDIPLPETQHCAKSIVHFATRTRNAVVVPNAGADEQFGNDEYILRANPRSILCLPLLQQGKLRGMLYMENNLIEGAFTEERVQLLQLLATQMAVSLENALLYEQMEQKIAARTRDLALANDELRSSNEQLRLLDEEKNELLGMVSHDLKNPLGAIIGINEMMSEEMLGEFPPVYKSLLGDQLHTARRMEQILQNLLQINALESGSVVMNFITFDPSSILRSISEDYSLRAAAKKITLHYECTSSALVSADEPLLYQIFENLLSNAIKYSPLEKQVWILASVESVEGLGQCFVARFKDEGHGILPEEMPRLFGKFARLSTQPTGNESSTGLGLSIVKKLVEGMKGRVWCESEYGKGATFLVALPVREETT
jgi:predicted ATPase/signal transduction histidine kinase